MSDRDGGGSDPSGFGSWSWRSSLTVMVGFFFLIGKENVIDGNRVQSTKYPPIKDRINKI